VGKTELIRHLASRLPLLGASPQGFPCGLHVP
jgi:hypothetical protein